MHYTIHTDGGARGNPGPAGAGVVIESEGKKIRLKKFLGIKTNNQAEYEALIFALEHLLKNYNGKDKEIITVYCFLDSKLVVEQLNKNYKVKNEGIKPLYDKVCKLAKNFHEINFRHIPRSQNTEADKLVNEAIDKQIENRNVE